MSRLPRPQAVFVSFALFLALEASATGSLQAQTLPAGEWLAGNCNARDGVDLSDVIYVLGHLFLGSERPCEALCDVDRNGSLDVGDPILLLSHLFSGQSVPPAPPPPEEICNLVDDDCDGIVDGPGCLDPSQLRRATVQWDRVLFDTRGSPETIDRYVIYYGMESGRYPFWKQVRGEPRLIIENLRPGTEYFLTVVARDRSGNYSRPSPEISFDVP